MVFEMASPRHSLFSVEMQVAPPSIIPVLVLLVTYFSPLESKVMESTGFPDLDEIHTLQGVQESQDETVFQ